MSGLSQRIVGWVIMIARFGSGLWLEARTLFFIAAPLPYAPSIWYGYDGDENRELNAGLSLEILPFQDHVSNLLTQFLLTVKQNLANVTFVDTDVVDVGWIDTLKELGREDFQDSQFYPILREESLQSRAEHGASIFQSSFPILGHERYCDGD